MVLLLIKAANLYNFHGLYYFGFHISRFFCTYPLFTPINPHNMHSQNAEFLTKTAEILCGKAFQQILICG